VSFNNTIQPSATPYLLRINLTDVLSNQYVDRLLYVNGAPPPARPPPLPANTQYFPVTIGIDNIDTALDNTHLTALATNLGVNPSQVSLSDYPHKGSALNFASAVSASVNWTAVASALKKDMFVGANQLFLTAGITSADSFTLVITPPAAGRRSRALLQSTSAGYVVSNLGSTTAGFGATKGLTTQLPTLPTTSTTAAAGATATSTAGFAGASVTVMHTSQAAALQSTQMSSAQLLNGMSSCCSRATATATLATPLPSSSPPSSPAKKSLALPLGLGLGLGLGVILVILVIFCAVKMTKKGSRGVAAAPS